MSEPLMGRMLKWGSGRMRVAAGHFIRRLRAKALRLEPRKELMVESCKLPLRRMHWEASSR